VLTAWGIYKTFTINIGKVLLEIPNYDLEKECQAVVGKRFRDVQERIEG
jgi:hypothetical protein